MPWLPTGKENERELRSKQTRLFEAMEGEPTPYRREVVSAQPVADGSRERGGLVQADGSQGNDESAFGDPDPSRHRDHAGEERHKDVHNEQGGQ